MGRCCEKIAQQPVVPKTQQQYFYLNDSAPKRVVDLTKLAFALEKYKQKNKSYPISSEKGKGWDGLYTKYGRSSENWIEGLAPTYIKKLPRDPRKNTSTSQQYLYRSDGANYKLLAYFNCQELSGLYQAMTDPRRKCLAYGYWTPRAAYW